MLWAIRSLLILKKHVMKYLIEQYPKNKDFDISKLNKYQIYIRNNQKVNKGEKTQTCTKCLKELPLKEFYFKDKETGRKSNSCRDCQMREAGIIEIGKVRFAKDILKKGFRRCSVCKNIKPLTSYSKSISGYEGYSNNCYECSNKLHNDFWHKQKNEIGYFYVRQYGIRKGITEFSNEIIEQLRTEIIESRKPKYFLNGNEFFTLIDFAKYIEVNYNIPITTTEKRISDGAIESDCIIQEKEYRKLKSGTNKGKIKVTDTITGEVYVFFNTKDEGLAKMFGISTITEGIKTGLPVGGKRSKYVNPCLIERINDSSPHEPVFSDCP